LLGVQQTKIGFVYESRRLQRLARPFLGHPPGSQLAQVVVDERQELFGSPRIALFDGRQDSRDVAPSGCSGPSNEPLSIARLPKSIRCPPPAVVSLDMPRPSGIVGSSQGGEFGKGAAQGRPTCGPGFDKLLTNPVLTKFARLRIGRNSIKQAILPRRPSVVEPTAALEMPYKADRQRKTAENGVAET
jgi:hypothetical protein